MSSREVRIRKFPPIERGVFDVTTKKHHYVPRYYLRRFADESGRLRVWEKGTGNSWIASIGDVCAINGLNTYTSRKGQKDDLVERRYSATENLTASAFRVASEPGKVPNTDVIQTMASALAIQLLRTPRIRGMLSNLGSAFIDGELPAIREGVRMSLEKHGFPTVLTEPAVADIIERVNGVISTDARVHYNAVSANLDPVAEAFYRREWRFYDFSRCKLGSCDNPVILVPGRQDAGKTTSPATAALVIVPLSRTRALILGPPTARPGGVDYSEQGTRKWANCINRCSAESADRFYYSHPNDTIDWRPN